MFDVKKGFLIKFVIPILIALSLFTGFLFMTEMETLNDAYADMNSIEFLSSSTQRAISLALTNQLNQKDIFFISSTTKEFLLISGSTPLSVLTNPDMVQLAQKIYDSWTILESVLQEEELDVASITINREAHFKAMTDLSNSIKDYSKDLNGLIANYQKVITFLLCLICLIVLNNLLSTHNQLRLSRELTVMAQLDTATGLFNRSRCQDLFKHTNNLTETKTPALVVVDLNDLKKTNDTLGHRVGDDLIADFAKCLKDACKANLIQPFVGRYGGDEFIIYYDDIQSADDIESYLTELDFLTEASNINENRFQIVYAAGYAIVDVSQNLTTVRQLFDKADQRMYENKVAMKRDKQRLIDEELAKGENVQ